MINQSDDGILALDIGTGKIAGVVGAIVNNRVQILSTGMNNHPMGFSKGKVIDFDQALKDLKQTIARICYSSSVSIQYLLINLQLHDIKYDYHKNGILLPENIGNSVDDQELRVYEKLASQINVQLLGFVPDSLAAGQIMVKKQEKQEGVLLLDCGRDHIHGAFYKDGLCQHLFEVPFGGRHITNDIAYGLSISRRVAEGIKIKYSNHPELEELADSAQFIGEIIDARLKEIFHFIEKEIALHVGDNSYSIILTGGMSKTRGLASIGEQYFQKPVTLRYNPVDETGLTVGADWEIIPVGELAFAVEHGSVDHYLNTHHILNSSQIIVSNSEKYTESIVSSKETVPLSPSINSKNDAENSSSQVISPVKVQPAKVSAWSELKNALSDIF